jgi:hypothetical protein
MRKNAISLRLRCPPWMRAAALCGALAGLPGAARAAEPAPDPSSWLTQSVAAVSGTLKSAGAEAASAWSAVTAMVTPSQSVEALPDLISDDDQRFFAVLNALGLQLTEIKLGSSFVASSTYRFVAVREPSIADSERAERKLADYRAAVGGVRAGVKQRIARSVLDLAGDKGFLLSAVVIELSAWPSAHYEMSARDRRDQTADRRVVDGKAAK